MKRYAKGLSIAVTLALAAAGQVAGAAPQVEPAKPSHAEKALEGGDTLSGKVVETMDAGGYTYVLLDKNGAKTWVAVPKMKVTVGEELAFEPGQEMVNFSSRTLKKTFEKIMFSGGPISKQGAAGADAVKSAHGGKSIEEMKAAQGAKAENTKIEKATGPNAFTVAEAYEKKVTLDKQKVVVKGKVVKVSTGIMGKTWVHLRDGSGDTGLGTNNLVVTTKDKDVPAMGDVVTASGTLYKDKDFGAGYKYDLIMEEATLQK